LLKQTLGGEEMSRNYSLMKLSTALLLILFAAKSGAAQEGSFSYQGRLTDGGNPANGQYEMQFLLYDTALGGIAISEPITNSNLQVTNGVFSVELGFGELFFTGAARYLEVRIRPAGSPDPYTILSPRQPILSVPYAIRSLTAASAENSNQLGGVSASGFIQNGSSQQASTNFNISGNGTAAGTLSGNAVNATNQYNINGLRALSVAGTNNLFVGLGTGAANTAGNSNTFVGAFAGNDNTTANNNSFFGAGAGRDTTTGAGNSFFGAFAGDVNTTGRENAFFGTSAGGANTTAIGNSFFGYFAGVNNTTAGGNSFFGWLTGAANTAGASNSFFGAQAGTLNTTGSFNSFFGSGAGEANTSGTGNSFFGRVAGADNTAGTDNSFFGATSGSFNTTGIANSFFGRAAGSQNTTGNYNSFFGTNGGLLNTTGSMNTFIGFQTATNDIVTGNNNTILGSNASVGGNVNFATAIGAETFAGTSNTVVLGRSADTVRVPGNLAVTGTATISSIFGGGSTQLCVDGSSRISTCSSSLRYKDRVWPFTAGVELINRLRPIRFSWKSTGERDLGLGAEEVAGIEPLLVTYNQQGEVEGVKYDRIGVVLINAIKQQQEQIRQQQSQIDGLKKIICLDHPEANVCK
jgi:hypothetical protein